MIHIRKKEKSRTQRKSIINKRKEKKKKNLQKIEPENLLKPLTVNIFNMKKKRRECRAKLNVFNLKKNEREKVR